MVPHPTSLLIEPKMSDSLTVAPYDLTSEEIESVLSEVKSLVWGPDDPKWKVALASDHANSFYHKLREGLYVCIERYVVTFVNGVSQWSVECRVYAHRISSNDS